MSIRCQVESQGDFMGTYKNKAYTLRIDNELMEKLKHCCIKEDRTVNKQIERLVREYITNYEAEHGSINIKTINMGDNHGTINM